MRQYRYLNLNWRSLRLLPAAAGIFSAFFWLQAAHCATNDTYKAVLIKDVPHVLQKPDFCGEACAEMWLRKLGYQINQDDVFNISGLDPLTGRGCCTRDLLAALTAIGFAPGDVWYKVAAGSEKEIRARWSELHADLLKGIPSIACMNTSKTANSMEHFRLVLGYDQNADAVIYHEPAEQGGKYKRMKLSEFLDLWPLKYDARVWQLIRFRLESRQIQKMPKAFGFTNADYAQHIMALKKKSPAGEFTIVIQEPWVVIGDESPEQVKARAEQTVAWATVRLKNMYFKKDPTHIIDIWLFKNDESYRKHALDIFGDTPTTPYGYSSDEHHALIMNIGTGGGTLIHEMVHPLIDVNFPGCPSWFNEGLGSLYEQSSGTETEIMGLTNWRLPDLQKAVRNGKVPRFKTLLSTTTDAFYTKDRGTNYAQARYLCYYLQEKGLLKKFYHEFIKNHATDPTGYGTLKAVLDEKDMDGFQRKWEKFVLSLSF